MRELLLLIVLLLTGCIQPFTPPEPVIPSPVPVIPTPSPDAPTTNALAELRLAATGLKANQRKRLSEFYAVLAATLERSPIAATSRIRLAHKEALTLMVGADDTFTNAPKVGDKIDAAITEAVTLEDRDLAPADKAKLVSRLREISATVGGR